MSKVVVHDDVISKYQYLKNILTGLFSNFIGGYKRYDEARSFVIQGKNERLAVECDGDHWHGPEKLEEDINRQRDLERCGWVFWRIRESSFYRDENESLFNLWKILKERGIIPTTVNINKKQDDNIQLKRNVA